jgi:hypothetical protein
MIYRPTALCTNLIGRTSNFAADEIKQTEGTAVTVSLFTALIEAHFIRRYKLLVQLHVDPRFLEQCSARHKCRILRLSTVIHLCVMLRTVKFFDKTAYINSVILHKALWEDVLYDEHSPVLCCRI